MTVTGSLKNIRFTDLSNGYSSFIVEKDGIIMSLSGLIPDYPKNTPVSAEVKRTKNGFAAEKVSLSSDNGERTVAFLATFPGIGGSLAIKIVSVTGADIFAYFRKHDSISVPGAKEGVIPSLVSTIKELLYREELYTRLFGEGADYAAISRLYAQFGKETIKKITDNPYLYTLIGRGSYCVSEHLGKLSGIAAYDKKRIHAIVMTAMKMNRDQGNTQISFEDLLHTVRYAEEKAGEGYRTEALFVAEEIMRDGYEMHISDDDTELTVELSYDRMCEKRLASDIKRLYVSRKELVPEGTPVSVSDVEEALQISYSEEQEEILKGITETGLYIITGGPGTGKTTLLKGILYKYHKEHPSDKVILCSPTGAAARRMSDATGKESSTIHRLLNIKPYEKDLLEYKREPLEASLIVADEVSMLDTEIAAVFLSAVKNGSTVLFLGDKDQLPSVGAGNVLGDMLSSGCIKSFRLEKVYRQGEGSLITENAHRVINGDTELLSDRTFSVIRCQNDKKVADTACSLYKRYHEEGHTGDMKLFSAVRNRKFVCGTASLNRRIKDAEGKPVLFSYGAYDYSEGEKIIFVKNNYAKGYYNGQEGYIEGADRNARGCTVYITNSEGTYTLTASELCDIEPAYAITAHKAQGSECDTAVIAVTKEPKNMLLRRLLYVEITRAKKQVVIVSERDALEDVIENGHDIVRHTGLCDEIKRAFAIDD